MFDKTERQIAYLTERGHELSDKIARLSARVDLLEKATTGFTADSYGASEISLRDAVQAILKHLGKRLTRTIPEPAEVKLVDRVTITYAVGSGGGGSGGGGGSTADLQARVERQQRVIDRLTKLHPDPIKPKRKGGK